MKPYNSYQNPQVLQQSPEIILVYKPIGWTPLEVVRYLQNTKISDEKLGYAGRLDPMAEGLLLLLRGEENKNKVKYERLSKTYDFTCTFGVKTDTLDVLGLLSHVSVDHQNSAIHTALQKELSTLQGNIDLQYPIYSAQRVNGKPLYYWARHGKLNEIELPHTKAKVFKIKLNNIYQITGEELANDSIVKIRKVNGDFRQPQIINRWNEFKNKYSNHKFTSAEMAADVSSGTYIRSLCEKTGDLVGIPAIATRIDRVAIGAYTYK